MATTILLLAVVLAVPALDQLTKALAMAATDGGARTVTVIPGALRLTIVRNTGATMGLFAGNAAGRVVFLTLSAVAIVGLILLLFVFRRKVGLPTFPAVCLALIAGGGIGNSIDRVFFGEKLFEGAVIDFIDFCAFPRLWHWVFNLADACICVGVALFLAAAIVLELRAHRRETSSRAAAGGAPDHATESSPARGGATAAAAPISVKVTSVLSGEGRGNSTASDKPDAAGMAAGAAQSGEGAQAADTAQRGDPSHPAAAGDSSLSAHG